MLTESNQKDYYIKYAWLQISLILQTIGIFSILSSVYFMANMSSNNMNWIFFIPLWISPSLVQIVFIIRDLIFFKPGNKILIFKKWYFILLLIWSIIYLFVILPFFNYYLLTIYQYLQIRKQKLIKT